MCMKQIFRQIEKELYSTDRAIWNKVDYKIVDKVHRQGGTKLRYKSGKLGIKSITHNVRNVLWDQLRNIS